MSGGFGRGRERGGDDRRRERIVVALSLAVLTFTVAGLVLSISPVSTQVLPPGVILYGYLTYADGSPAPNVEVTVKNETSGISLSPTTTDEKGVWTIEEVLKIANCGDEVLIYAKDAWNNEVSKKVNIICDEDPLQRIENLSFEVPKPTTTPSPSPSSPPSDGDGSSGGGGTSGGGTFTPTPTSTPIPTVTSPSPSPSIGISNASIISETKSNTSQTESESKPEQEQEPEGKSMPISLVVGVGAGIVLAVLALIMGLVYRRYKKV